MKMQLTPEQEEWKRRLLLKLRPGIQQEFPVDEPPPVEPPKPVFTDSEIAWLWPRFQKCRHRSASFAKSFAKTPLANLTPKGKAVLHSTAYTYRQQIFANSEKWTEMYFIAAVKQAAATSETP